MSDNENWLGLEKWQKRDLNGYFEIKENFEDFKKSLQESLNNGVISKILDEVNNDEEMGIVVHKSKSSEGLIFSHEDERYGNYEELTIDINKDNIEIYHYNHYRDHGDYDDFVRIQPTLNGNAAVLGDPSEFINDGTGDFSRHRILSIGVRGLMTYDESKPIDPELKAKLLQGEKNKINSIQKYEIENTKNRLRGNSWRNQKLTLEIRKGMDESTPIKEVPADAPFKVMHKRRGGMGD